ncbi:putative alcohol dehydrogenase [Xylariales sp. PMI_506]|nr:putative alcohol dehydrogenase [Xylariales sp. PMI_506]
MTTMKAIAIIEDRKAAITDVPVPNVRDGWVLVKVKAVALNPTDWKHIDHGHADPGALIGCDYAGVVEKVGANVAFKKGDRIAGFVHGGNRCDHEEGSFAEYLISKASVQIKVPDDLSLEQAATLGISAITCGQGLYKSLKLPLPTSPAAEPFPLLIHGGSTATGMLGIQYAKASGLTVIATSSPHNFDRLKSLGADAVFDYRSPTCSSNIRKWTQNKLRYAWDCIGRSEVLCAEALSDAEPSWFGTIVAPLNKELLLATNHLVDGPHWTLGYRALGEPFELGGTAFPPSSDELEFAQMFYKLTRDLLEKGVIKPVDIQVNMTGPGLEGVMKGMDEMRAGRVSGTKLVYTI